MGFRGTGNAPQHRRQSSMPRLTATERKLKEEVAIAEAHAQELLQRVADLK